MSYPYGPPQPPYGAPPPGRGQPQFPYYPQTQPFPHAQGQGQYPYYPTQQAQPAPPPRGPPQFPYYPQTQPFPQPAAAGYPHQAPSYPQHQSPPAYPQQPPARPSYPQPQQPPARPSYPQPQQPPARPSYPQPSQPKKQTQAPSLKYPTVSGLDEKPTTLVYPKVQELAFYERVYHAHPDSFWAQSKLHFNPWSAQSWKLAKYPQVSGGQGLYPTVEGGALYPTIDMPAPPMAFTLAEFQELRHHCTESSALAQLRDIATDITNIDAKTWFPPTLRRACFISANTYTDPKRKLGVGPINDSIVVAANHRCMGYEVFFIFNASQKQYRRILKEFLKRTTDWLTCYFTGHGTQSRNYDGTESSGYDQQFVFEDGYVKDDKLASYLKKYSKGVAKTLLLNDCCHSGTIWDIPRDPVKAMEFPANIVSYSATDDAETAKQTEINRNSQGLFTFYFWKLVKEHPTITMEQLKPLIDQSVSKYNQHCVMIATRTNILTQPFFPPRAD